MPLGEQKRISLQNRLDKYFWDSPITTFSIKYQIIRLLEYAAFPDLFAYPFADLQSTMPQIDLDRCRISEARKALFKQLTPFLSISKSLNEAIMRYIDSIFAAKGITPKLKNDDHSR